MKMGTGWIWALIVFAAAGYWGCTPTVSPPKEGPEVQAADSAHKKMNMNKIDECAEALTMILERDFRNWKGMPLECDWTKLVGPLPDIGPDGHWKRAFHSSNENYWSMNLKIEGYDGANFTFEDRKALLFDGRNPDLAGGVASLLKALGEPEAKLDWDDGILAMPGMEWIYPGRGIALFMSAEGTFVSIVALFESTTIQGYSAKFRIKEKKVDRPGKHGKGG
jgi:hypothetical protein